MIRDLKNISIVKRSKAISTGHTARSIQPCIINGEKLIIKTHRNDITYNREKNAYILLQNENFLPKLVYFNDKNLKLCITDVGDALPIIKKIKNINLKDYEKELVNIIDIMHNKYNIFHNDLRPFNICIDKNNNIKLIDFDQACNKEKENKYIFRDNKHNFPSFYF